MRSFVIVAVFLVEVTLVLSGRTSDRTKPAPQVTQPAAESSDPSFDFKKVITSFGELSSDQLEKVTPEIEALSNIFEQRDIFGSFFSTLLNKFENPSVAIPKVLKSPISTMTFMSAIQDLPMEMITESQPHLDTIIKVLGSTDSAKVFKEISSIMAVRIAMIQLEAQLPSNFMGLSAGADVQAAVPSVISDTLNGLTGSAKLNGGAESQKLPRKTSADKNVPSEKKNGRLFGTISL